MSARIPQLITIGETMVLVAPVSAEPLTTAEEFHLDAGGAESNVAAHASCLGVPSAWVSAVGADALGQRLLDTIKQRGVQTQWVTVDDRATTGVYFKDPGGTVLYYRSGSAASRMNASTVAAVPLEHASIVHVTGITPALSANCAQLIDAVFKRVALSNSKLSFDVNYRPPLWTSRTAATVLRSLAQRADIVFVGLDEAHELWGCDTPDDVRAALPEPSHLIVKNVDVGATEFCNDEYAFVPAIQTEVFEAIGAGDAFAGGYLPAMLQGASIGDRLLAGHQQARLVLQSTTDFLPQNKRN